MESGGWYPDPEQGPGTVRWWDGEGWTEQTARAGSAQTRRPPQTATPNRWQRLLRRTPEPEPMHHVTAGADWRSRPAAQQPAVPYDDPEAGIVNAPYDAPVGGSTGRRVPRPYEDPNAGIYAARPGDPPSWDSPWGSTVDNAPPPDDVISQGGGYGGWRGVMRTRAFGVAVIIALLVGVAVVGMRLNGSANTRTSQPLTLSRPVPTPDRRPPLEQICAHTTPSQPDPKAPRTPPPPGPRIDDQLANISYAAQASPFRRWNLGPWGDQNGGLGEVFTTGQYFVTQRDTPDNSPYMATILSGTVPATYGDDPHPNIECAAKVISDDVRESYYPQPNTRREVTARSMTVSGRPAYLLEFHLAFNQPGYDAKGEYVAICVVDVPGNEAAALYVSIPDTHRQYDKIVQPLMESIRIN